MMSIIFELRDLSLSSSWNKDSSPESWSMSHGRNKTNTGQVDYTFSPDISTQERKERFPRPVSPYGRESKLCSCGDLFSLEGRGPCPVCSPSGLQGCTLSPVQGELRMQPSPNPESLGGPIQSHVETDLSLVY